MNLSLPRCAAVTALGAGLLTQLAAAQTQVPFPFTATGQTQLNSALLAPNLLGISELTQHQDVLLTGVKMPDGTTVNLELERIDVARRQFGIQVNGEAYPNAFDDLSLSVWKGQIAGDPASDVMLGFSNYGTRGWVRTRTELVHVLPAQNDQGGWFGAQALLTTEQALNDDGYMMEGDCKALPPAVAPVPSAFQGVPDIAALRTIDTVSLRECTIAMETDYQLYELFNDLNATTSYLTTLLSFISDRYELQTSTVLTFPYLQIYTNSNDPWSTPENGGGSIDMLNEFVTAWQGNVPMGATLGHMMSGASLGGGVAYLNVLCSNDLNFGVSGNIGYQGFTNFPVVQQPFNWDFIVVAHELGHNFGSPHTHDYCPPLDECPSSQLWGQCQTQQVCSNSGSIMSYCHLCPGGTGNITTYFHPEAAAVMADASRACNPATYEVIVNAPDLVSDSSGTPTTLNVTVGSLSSARLNYRAVGAANYTTVTMNGSGSTFTADIPASACGQVIEYYFDFDVVGLGNFTAPAGAPGDLYTAITGFESVAYGDDFEADTGWTTANLGASSGDWQRGVPVNDGGWQYDPTADGDGSGSAYLTQNETGNTDVDGGAVELTSPTFDMSNPGASVSYDYFLRLTNSDGEDRLLVEASASGGAWTEITRHDLDNGLSWTNVTLTSADFAAAGVTPTASMRMRFTANDADDQSIVEAGVDGFTVSSIDCGGLGVRYCSPANANSTGSAASIAAEGSSTASDNDVTLSVESLPANTVGYFLTSETQGFVANAGGSSGNLCLSNSVGRYNGNVLSSGAGGTYSLVLDLTATPQPTGFVSVMAGETWNFQSWYRDAVGGSTTSNFTDAVEIAFQ